MKLLLIGGLPSSGSTRLVYLLSKINRFLCLPETGLFTQGQSFGSNLDELSNPLHARIPWINIQAKTYQATGWDIALDKQGGLNSCPIETLKNQLEISSNTILVEKTPENIFAFESYLRNDRTRKVVITLRDLESTCFSQMKRKFSMIEGIIIWFAYAFEAWRLLKKYPSQILPVSYEELCNAPENIHLRVLNFFENKSIFALKKTADTKNLSEDNLNYQWFVKQSSWTLSSRYWSKEIDASSDSKVVRWRLGIEFDALVDSIAIKTHENGLIKPRLLDSALKDKSIKLRAIPSEDYRPLNMIGSTPFMECLVKSYPVHLRYSSDGRKKSLPLAVETKSTAV